MLGPWHCLSERDDVKEDQDEKDKDFHDVWLERFQEDITFQPVPSLGAK